ncbi:hypothetical protein KH5_08800 [Urechidicola sp. KH5]
MTAKKQLTICIPTYNRLEFIKKQLEFFYNEFKDDNLLLNRVNIIIGDNASTDQTADFLSNYKRERDFFDLVINPNNLGIVGNINNLLELAETEYVWFVSDDDELRKGVVRNIFEIIDENKNLNFIFLNFLFFGNRIFSGKTGLRVDSKEAVNEVFREYYGSLILITACIYKKSNLLELRENEMKKWLSAPLLYSFYSSSKGPVYLTKKNWINYRDGQASYASFKRVSRLKFEEFVPILESLPKYGYDRKENIKTIKLFFEKQSHAHFLYNFLNFTNSLKLYKYYGFKAFLQFPFNVLDYLRK